MTRLLTLSLMLLSTVHPAPKPSPQRFDKVDATNFIREYLQRNAVPGAVVVVTDGNGIVLSSGIGQDLKGNPMSEDTRVPLASLSKSMTATAVMQLVDQGSVDLDAPVVKYLPEFQLADARFRSITVRQLLMHTSGMSDRTFREKSVSPVPATLKDAVASLRSARLASDPGKTRNYHNPNYWVAARMVEVVSHQPFSVYMHDHIFLPAHMERTDVVDSLKEAHDVAPGSIRIFNHAFAKEEPEWFLGGCCGVISTAHDLAQWLIVQNSDLQTLTSEKSLRLMHDGLGWNRSDLDGQTVFSHNGLMFTYSAEQYLLPQQGKKLGIAVVANSGLGLAPLPADEIAKGLLTISGGAKERAGFPVGPCVDAILLVLIVGTAALAIFRGRRGVSTGRLSQTIKMLVAAGLLLFVAAYPNVLRFISRRDGNWEQSLLVAPLLFLLLVVSAVSIGVLSFIGVRQEKHSSKAP